MFGLSLGHLGVIVGSSWGHVLGNIWVAVGPLAGCVRTLAHVWFMFWICLGYFRVMFGTSFVIFGHTYLDQVGAIVEPFRDHIWVIFGSYMVSLAVGAILGSSWVHSVALVPHV